MAVAYPPEILAYQLSLSAGQYSSRLYPLSGSWEVHSIVGSGKFTVYRSDDPDADGNAEVLIPIAQRASAGEITWLKVEVGPNQAIVIKNDEESNDIDIEIIGIRLK